MALDVSAKEKSVLEEQLIEKENEYLNELLEYYESGQALREKIDALERELLRQNRLSEARIAGIIKVKKEEWEKDTQARLQSAVGNAIQRTIHECNELLVPYTVRRRETLQNTNRKH